MRTYFVALAVLGLFVTTKAQRTDPQNISVAFSDVAIVPDMIKMPPKLMLKVRYPRNVSAQLGNVLTPTQVKKQPRLRFPVQPDTFYTVIMSDADGVPPLNREFRHWIVGNMPGNFITEGDLIVDYVGAAPQKGSGFHRYVFLLYKQRNRTIFDEPRLSKINGMGREKFSTELFATKYNLGDPVAGNFFMAEFDDYVPLIEAQLKGT